MASFRFSRRAEVDLLSIAAYTLGAWGEQQTIRYIDDLEACCKMLADNPSIGRASDVVSPGLRRLVHRRHVVYYREAAGGILISRILHRSMLPERQSIDDEDA